MITVAQLRKRGLRVRVLHKRILDPETQTVSPCGGETAVEITDETSGKTFTGVALCSVKDNYSKKVGVRLAIERALLTSLETAITPAVQPIKTKKKAAKK